MKYKTSFSIEDLVYTHVGKEPYNGIPTEYREMTTYFTNHKYSDEERLTLAHELLMKLEPPHEYRDEVFYDEFEHFEFRVIRQTDGTVFLMAAFHHNPEGVTDFLLLHDGTREMFLEILKRIGHERILHLKDETWFSICED